MERSHAVAAGLRGLYDAFSAGDPAAFERGIARDPDAFVIGTQRWGAGRDHWLASFQELVDAGVRLRLAEDGIRAWAEGTVGWAVDRPAFVLPDGSRLPTRLSAVLRHEDGAWQVVHAHFSVAVPDEVALEQAHAWLEQLGEPAGGSA